MLLCPRCREPLTDPPEAFCPRCGAAIEGEPDLSPPRDEAPAAEATPPPTPPLPPPAEAAEAPPPGIPWDDRERLGFATALVDTTVQVLRSPGDFYRRMRPAGGVGSALAYAVIVAYAGFVAKAFYDWIFQMVLGRQELGFGPELERAIAMMQGGGGLLLQLILGPFLLAAALFVSAGLNHLALLLLGGARRGFDSTFRVCAFANAANVTALLPICGSLVAAVWIVVLTIIGLSVVHGISWQKATGAVLLPLVVFCCCCAGGIGLLAGMLAATASTL
jgi:hypothetical protein